MLLSEGASTSAREAITALGLRGHEIEVCDPNPYCLARFSSFVSRFHRCPGIGGDPEGYLEFVTRLLATGQFDILLPIHEQGLLFAKVKDRIPSTVGIALPSFDAYAQALDKMLFSLLLTELCISQPKTLLLDGVDAIPRDTRYPYFLKRPLGTASRAVWFIQSDADLECAKAEIGAPAEGMLLQEFVEGPIEHAQALFDRGRFVAMHGYRQIVAGAGGGEAVKESVWRPQVREALETIAVRLAWHGAISVDYILHKGVAHFFDCNPRLVEPMSAALAGTDLIDLLISISLGEHPLEMPAGRIGMRTHLGMQALLGTAIRTGSRMSVIAECWRLATLGGEYASSQEELTPVSLDCLSVVPFAAAFAVLVANPAAAHHLSKRGWGAGLLTPAALRLIRVMPPTSKRSEQAIAPPS